MTPEELARALVEVVPGRLAVPADAFDPAVAAYLRRYLPGGSLELTGWTRTDGAPGTVRVVGTGTAPPFTGMDVTLEVVLPAAGDAHVTVTAVGRAGWSLGDAFGVLAGTRFAGLRFDRPTLVLDSAVLASAVLQNAPGAPAPDPDDAPMAFDGTWLAEHDMALMELLFPGGSHHVEGELVMVDLAADLPLARHRAPWLLLTGRVGSDADLGLVHLRQVSFELVGLPKPNLLTWDAEVLGLLVLRGELVAGSGPLAGRPVPVSAQVPGWGTELVLAADFSQLGSLSLADVVGLAGLAGQAELALPDDVDPGPAVSLRTVELHVDLAGPAVRSVHLTVETETEWTIVEDLLVLQAIDLTVRVDRPLPPPGTVAVTVSGLFTLGEHGTLVASVSPYSRELSCELREGDPPLSVREVWEHFTGEPATHLPALDVTSFRLYGRVPATSADPFVASGELELAGSWPLAPHVDLTDLRVEFSYDDAATFHVLAAFDVGGVDVDVRAGYDPDPERGWEFAGTTGPGQQIPLGALAKDLATRFGLTLPAVLSGLVLRDLSVAVASGAGTLALGAGAQFPLDGDVLADVRIDIDTGARRYDGSLELTAGAFHPRLQLHLDQDPTATRFAATYSHPATDPAPPLADLVAAVSPAAARFVPRSVQLDPRTVLLARTAGGSGARYLLGVDLAATVDLTGLPVVGPHLTRDTLFGLDPLRLLALSGAVSGAEAAALNRLLPDGLGRLPEHDLPAGFVLDAVLRLGPFDHPVTMPVHDPTAADVAPAAAPVGPAVAAGDGMTWITVNRSIGPVQLGRIGVAWRHDGAGRPRIALAFDATLALGGLTLTLQGLAVEVATTLPLEAPTFHLGGLGLDYSGGGLEVGGALLAGTVSYQGVSYPGYVGAAHLRTPTMSLAALGGYADLPTGPSLFVYAVLDYPLGGPVFFFVRGLAAGFGYHRRLVIPPVDDVPDFPLVAEALGHRAPAAELGDELRALETYLPVSPGDYFLAVGVHFTSFEMIDSFALVAATFGHRFELTVLGTSTLVLPAPDVAGTTTSIARVELALRASIVPSEGSLVATAQLTRNSFLLSPDCHLTGGYGFAAWFAGDHAGDFAVTAGGYHPHFDPPDHYPVVPRLGFSWQVTPQLSVRGAGYYALTPHALMAGANLEATWRDHALSASFGAGMDLLISWQPYHYSARAWVSVQGSYTYWFFGTRTITASVGAELSLWGPEFSGTATIDLSITSFTVHFGDSDREEVRPVSWAAFASALLPAPEKVLSVGVRSSVHRRGSAPPAAAAAAAAVVGAGAGAGVGVGVGDGPRDLGAVDPGSLMITIDSLVPVTEATAGGAGHRTVLDRGTATTAVGVGPLALPQGEFGSALQVTITGPGGGAEDRFDWTPSPKSVPFALWGGRLLPTATDPTLLADVLSGYTLTPRAARRPLPSITLARSELAAGAPVATLEAAIQLDPPQALAAVDPSVDPAVDPAVDPGRRAEDGGRSTLAAALGDPAARAVRARIAAALLPDAAIDVDALDPAAFLETPMVVRHG